MTAIHRLAEWSTRHLSRVTSRGDFIPEVDGIRFLAIVGVIVFHSVLDINWLRGTPDALSASGQSWPAAFIAMGWFGVEIFFVLSGFIVCLPFARHAVAGSSKPNLGHYYLRRVTRIEPPYILALTAMYLDSSNLRQGLPDYLASLVYSHNYVFGTPNPFALMLWSLEVEVAFYALAPWFVLLYRIAGKQMRWIVEALLLLFGSYWVVRYLPTRLLSTLPHLLPYFLGGMILADWHACGLLRRTGRLSWDFAAVCAAFGLASLVNAANHKIWTYYWLAPPLLVVLFAGIFKGRLANWFLRLRPVTIVGGMCYTLYLWHTFLLIHMPVGLRYYLARLPYSWGMAACVLIKLPAIVLLSIPIYLVFERPFMKGLIKIPSKPVPQILDRSA